MVDVFISYKREERAKCEAIAKYLSELKLNVWFDAKIRAGEAFDRHIENAVKAAKSVLVVWSKMSVDSEWVRNEASLGRRNNKLIAMRIEEVELPIEFTHIHYEDVFSDYLSDSDPNWVKIVDGIGKLVGRGGLGAYVSARAARTDAALIDWANANSDDPLAAEILQRIKTDDEWDDWIQAVTLEDYVDFFENYPDSTYWSEGVKYVCDTVGWTEFDAKQNVIVITNSDPNDLGRDLSYLVDLLRDFGARCLVVSIEDAALHRLLKSRELSKRWSGAIVCLSDTDQVSISDLRKISLGKPVLFVISEKDACADLPRYLLRNEHILDFRGGDNELSRNSWRAVQNFVFTISSSFAEDQNTFSANLDDEIPF